MKSSCKAHSSSLVLCCSTLTLYCKEPGGRRIFAFPAGDLAQTLGGGPLYTPVAHKEAGKTWEFPRGLVALIFFKYIVCRADCPLAASFVCMAVRCNASVVDTAGRLAPAAARVPPAKAVRLAPAAVRVTPAKAGRLAPAAVRVTPAPAGRLAPAAVRVTPATAGRLAPAAVRVTPATAGRLAPAAVRLSASFCYASDASLLV